MIAIEKPRTAPAPAEPAPRRQKPWGLLLVAGAAVLYLWNLTASGWGNSYYAAATQAGTQSWKALLFGSLDAGNVITVDKPPASLWLSGLFGRVFGFSSWSVLAPQALAGVASVWLLYAAVRRTSGLAAGLLAGVGLALTPVATLMFRFNLPDPLLVLLLIAAAYATIRAVEKASVGWLVLAGTAIGFAFLTKMLQGFLTLPAMALVYLVAAPTTLGRRIAHLAAAAGAVVVSSGWYVALVELWPAASRPYIGGSTNDSFLELALGYNGLGRIFGGEGNPGGGGGGGFGNVGFGGASGLGRMFGASFGTEVSWLLPAALVGLVAGLWFSRHAPRTDRTRAALLLWGGWLVVTALVFSFMSGIIHPYYSVALAPGIAGVTAISARELWRGRAHPPVRYVLTGMMAVTGVWTFILLDRWPDWLPWLRWLILALTVVVSAAIAVGVRARALAVAGIVTALLGTGTFSVATASVAHSGSIPTSGPTSDGEMGGGPGGGMMGGSASSALTTLLSDTDTEWAAATMSAQSAGELELATGRSVIAIGGFSGGDPAPTLAEFQQYVAEGRIGYYVSMGGGMRAGGSSDIEQWVSDNFSSRTVGGQTVYDLRG
ncbi:ArnT family glycosyltransferase [Actinophytocola oryzae]|uniref:4-amino-4-deoxy-L-arabinose transferase-like glycosyltransferase n=1 Tax=Actinophytocola oryzae TaxID=502181 RepID=A0A4R7VRA3_9PSEU|nr:glycosyltransferase family 39 protein [Actinophytocola oryzae]TDV52313.1 4-amino-4-deoxy-L-arabinose transferase-like glycosyltransferase [Actinophytocola oryzae]